METNRLLSRQFDGDDAHLTRGNFFAFAASFMGCKGGGVKELKGLVLTCAVLLNVAMPPELSKTQINGEESASLIGLVISNFHICP